MDLLSKVINGEIKPYQVEKELHGIRSDLTWEQIVAKANDIRRMYLESKTGGKFTHIGKYSAKLDTREGKIRIENPIGCVQTPVGFAGPLNIKGSYAQGDFFAPLATNEAALIASVNKGMSVLGECKKGYVAAKLTKDFMTRAPIVKTRSLEESLELKKWIEENFMALKIEAEKTTKHGKLEKIETFINGRYVYPRMYFSTGDAMGMNMVTIAVQAAMNLLEAKNEHVKVISLSGNLCSDKKATAINALLGRGKEVHTEIFVENEALEKHYEVKAEDIAEIIKAKTYFGSSRAGTITGFNAHVANTIAAIYLATGQDMAQLIESATGFVWYNVTEDGIAFGMTFPCLELGTVGGGTSTETAKECLQVMGCEGTGKAKKLAEIIAAVATVGEFNLYGSLAKGDLAESHAKLTR